MKLRFDGKEYTKYYPADERKAVRNECLCAATGILFFVPLVSAPDSQYGKFWANQGAITFGVELLCIVVGLICKGVLALIGLIPFLHGFCNFLFTLILIVLWAVAIFYIVTGMIYAAKRRAKNLPFIGGIRFFK
ncbi:MAG: hypothetical protein KBT31_05670 [Firmicutes bacterium]|nr:hypothetical protein [Candidatus Colimorpha enterica]